MLIKQGESMKLPPREQPGVKKLSVKIRTHLISRFQLDPEQVDQMRCVEEKGEFGSLPVRYVRVFDPVRLLPADANAATNDYLKDHQEANLFDLRLLRVEKDLYIYAIDLRSKCSNDYTRYLAVQLQ